ncbi:MAG: hypothetical protein VB934_14620 [Polyangiaceae bacterium]
MRVSEFRFLAAALVLHLALPVAAAIAPARDELAGLDERGAIQEIEVDIDDTPPPPIDERPLPLPEDRETSETPRLPLDPHRVPYVAPTASARPAESATPTPTAAPMTAKLGTDEYNRPPIYGPGQIPGAGGPSVWQVLPGATSSGRARGPAAPTTLPKRKIDRKAAERALEAGMLKKDQKLGLDFPAASAIASVVRRTVRGSEAPYTCSAGFSIALGPQGTTRSVSLLHHQGGSRALWQGIKGQILAALSARQFPMRSAFAKGAIVTVSVNSTTRKPAGGTSRKGLSFSFDPSDIGARKTRFVTVGSSAQPVR